MAFPTKIATCCHCGTRAMLVADRSRHTLACESCGAPLRDLKMMQSKKAKPAVSHQPKVQKPRKQKREKKRKKRSWFDVIDEVWDAVDDIFD